MITKHVCKLPILKYKGYPTLHLDYTVVSVKIDFNK